MSALTTHDLDRFHLFAVRQLEEGGTERTLEELVELWQTLDLSAEELDESVTAVRNSLESLRSGERGITADEHLRQLREKFQLADHADGV